MDAIKTLVSRFRRTAAMFDKSAWMLITPAIIGIYVLDAALARTMLTWMLFALVIAGAAVIISRIIFPQINLSALLRQVNDKSNTAAGIVVAALILFVGLVMLALVLWAKA